MDRIKAFISYSSQQKIIGGKFKYYLSTYCGYETFIAHNDILGSSIWEEEIINAIENADFFIPLISNSFKASDFTDQETGIAVNLQKKIIPIKLEQINPYGFISKYQALQYKIHPSQTLQIDNIKELILAIARIGLSYQKYQQKTVDSLVYAFCESKSFEITNAIIGILSTYKNLTPSHLQRIIRASKTNEQILGAWGLQEFKNFLFHEYKIVIDE